MVTKVAWDVKPREKGVCRGSPKEAEARGKAFPKEAGLSPKMFSFLCMKLRMFTSAHIFEIAFSEVLRIPIYMMCYLVPFRLGNSSMNQFPAIIPYRISFWIVMKPSHNFLLSTMNS